MSPREALLIIQTLANGIDPLAGEVLSEHSPFNHEVIRALFAGAQALGQLTGAAVPSKKRAECVFRGYPSAQPVLNGFVIEVIGVKRWTTMR